MVMVMIHDHIDYYKYRGATRVMKDSYMHYSIPLRDDDIIEERKKVGRL